MYICITFMNIITFDYFVFTWIMLESVVKCSEFVYIREWRYTKIIYYYLTKVNLPRFLQYCHTYIYLYTFAETVNG